MNTDKHLHKYRSRTYTCLNFIRDVWLDLTGTDIATVVQHLFRASPRLSHNQLRYFKRLKGPVSPCIVCVSQFGHDPHVGIYYNGLVLHLGTTVPERVTLNRFMMWYNDVRFYQ